MDNVTIHRYTKIERPISVNKVPFGVARFEDKLWQVYGKNGKALGCSCTKSSLLEFTIRQFLKTAK